MSFYLIVQIMPPSLSQVTYGILDFFTVTIKLIFCEEEENISSSIEEHKAINIVQVSKTFSSYYCLNLLHY